MAAQWRLEPFEERFFNNGGHRVGDARGAYEHDRDRIIHSAAFRRLQNKTQVSAPRESDFHRTRLTHSLETAQIGEGIATALRNHLQDESADPTLEYKEYERWIPSNHLISAACYAHDLGHPPLGHAGEIALNAAVNRRLKNSSSNHKRYGGFEANAHTVRLLTTLEPYYHQGGINPTRRTILAVLKYPLSFRQYARSGSESVCKCYFESERRFVEWAADPFPESDRTQYLHREFTALQSAHIQWFRTLDATLMDCADEIAYSTHDVEDAISRGFLHKDEFQRRIESYTSQIKTTEGADNNTLFVLPVKEPPVEVTRTGLNEIVDQLFSDQEWERKKGISRLVHIFIVSLVPTIDSRFQHPLLRYGLAMSDAVGRLLGLMKTIVNELVINRPVQQMLEARGQRMMTMIFDELYTLATDTHNGKYFSSLFPSVAAASSAGSSAQPPVVCTIRTICDYIASKTDVSIENIYHLLFTPGYGSSSDEL